MDAVNSQIRVNLVPGEGHRHTLGCVLAVLPIAERGKEASFGAPLKNTTSFTKVKLSPSAETLRFLLFINCMNGVVEKKVSNYIILV